MSNANRHDAVALLDLIKPGMTIYVPGSSGEPTALLRQLACAPEVCAGVHFITSFVPGINDFDLSTLGAGTRFTAFFMHPSLRHADAEGQVHLLELPYSGIAQWLAEYPIDLALVQVSAEVRSGFFNLGPAVEFTPIVLDNAKLKVAVQNHRCPWLAGSVCWPVEAFDLVIQADTPLPDYADPEPNQVYARIGAQVADLLPNGATLQTGLGQAPAAALNALISHKDLGFHSGVFSDSLLRLLDAGVMDPGKPLLTCVAVGTSAFYPRLADYPGLRFASVSDTHSAENLRAVKRLFTINSAIEVDLKGNLNAEFLKDRRISGRGGLPDFAAAGHQSDRGASIIVLPATDGSGTRSRIVKSLQYAATVAADLVDFVITEHGCAHLNGLNLAARAAAMRSIAAPQHREFLLLQE